jgi:hypothetical protein
MLGRLMLLPNLQTAGTSTFLRLCGFADGGFETRSYRVSCAYPITSSLIMAMDQMMSVDNCISQVESNSRSRRAGNLSSSSQGVRVTGIRGRAANRTEASPYVMISSPRFWSFSTKPSRFFPYSVKLLAAISWLLFVACLRIIMSLLVTNEKVTPRYMTSSYEFALTRFFKSLIYKVKSSANCNYASQSIWLLFLAPTTKNAIKTY